MSLADALIEELSRKLEFADGVLPSINWCLFEVLDNVFEHAQSDTGYFMAQIHKNSKQLSVCIADTGIGVHRSFYLGGVYRPRTAFDALTLAVREGVSRTGDRRGNGLYGLKGVVEKNGGRLSIASGKAYLQVSPSGMDGRNVSTGINLSNDNHCAVIDFQLNVSNPVDIGNVLGSQVVDLRLEAIESNEGLHVIQIRDHSYGTGSREAARELGNHLRNYLSSGAPCLILDFNGVTMVSSSFADETIGKLAGELGAITFAERFRLINMTSTVKALLDRAIAIRLGAAFTRDDATPRSSRRG